MRTTLLVIAALSWSLAGCSADRCEAAVSSIQEKAESCGLLTYQDIDSANDEHSRTCSDQDAQSLERQATCTQDASCDALSGKDVAANEAYANCLAGL